MVTFLQIISNSIVSGLLLSLVAIGFTYIFRVTKIFHIAHSGIYILGGFMCWLIVSKTANFIFSILLSMVFVSLVIILIEKTIYLPLSHKKSNQSISLITSLGIYTIIVNLIAMFFGNELKIFENISEISHNIEGFIFTNIKIIQLLFSILLIICFSAYLWVSKSRLTLQCISDNETISKGYGININRERVKVLIWGSILACSASVLKSLEIGIDLQSGLSITLTAAVIAILSTRLNLKLIISLSICLSLFQNFVEWFLNAQWKDGITFLILLFVILYRTEGIISYNLRKDTL